MGPAASAAMLRRCNSLEMVWIHAPFDRTQMIEFQSASDETEP